jgi:hypothetical protein
MARMLGILALGLPLLAACASGPTPQPAATSQAKIDQAMATVQVAATQVAPTAQAVSTQVAPTVQAAATQVSAAVGTAVATTQPMATVAPAATAAAAAAGTAAAGAPMRIVDAKLGLPDTTLTLRNSGAAPVDLTGWGLRAGDATAALPSSAQVAPGSAVTLHTTSGASTPTDIYLGGAATSILPNLRSGQRIALVDGQGRVVSEMMLP